MSDLTPARDISLFQLESQLRELMEFRDTEELTPDERAVVEQQIAEYVTREIAKVDNLRAYMRHCQIMAEAAAEEVKLQSARAHSWKQRLEYLKGCCLDAMNVMGKKKLEGRTGYIQVKGNGGKQALTITDIELVPDELCFYEGRMPAWIWRAMARFCLNNGDEELMRDVCGVHLTRSPNGEAIRATMEKNCEDCNGYGTKGGEKDDPKCEACNGTGKQSVPGARLEPRGSHIEVK